MNALTPDRGDLHRRPAVLDGAQPGHGQLLHGLVGVAERRVVGLHDQQVARRLHDVADQPVVGHLEADDVGDRRLPIGSVAGRRRREVRAPGRPRVNRRAKLRSGMYSPNGTGCRLTYAAPGPVPGAHTMAALLRRPAGPLHDRADQHRRPIALRRRRSAAARPR